MFISSIVAFYLGMLDLTGLIICLTLLGLVILSKFIIHSVYSAILKIIFYIFLIPILLHILPGFHNIIILNKVTLSQYSAPFTMYMNFDKLYIISLMVIAFYDKRTDGRISYHTVLRYIINDIVKILPIAILVLLGLAYVLGFIQFDPKFNFKVLILWITNNLLVVCLGEEILFRSLLMKDISYALQKYTKLREKSSILLMISLSSLIFGLSHMPNIPFALLACFAGIFYAIAYIKNNRIESAILLHFIVNLIHITLFTYPYTKL